MPTPPADRPLPPNAEALRQKMLSVWNEAKEEYKDAGEPFGPSTRAIEVWMTYGRITNAN